MPGGGAVYYYDESGAGISIDAGPIDLTVSIEGTKAISVAVNPGPLAVTLSLHGVAEVPEFEVLEPGFFIIGKIEDRVIA